MPQKLSRKQHPKWPPGFEKPEYDLTNVRQGIVHIGLGGFHRAHMARYTHDLMGIDATALDWGIAGAGLRETDRPLLGALAGQDGLFTLTEREGGAERRAVIGSIVSVIDASDSTERLLAAIDDPRTRIVSVTVTANGYCLDQATKTLDFANQTIVDDLESGNMPRSVPGILVAAYRSRRKAGRTPFTTLCCDNIESNGAVLRAAVIAMAARQDEQLAAWIEQHARFPNAMVDRITPAPASGESERLAAETGLDDRAPLGAELFRQWVIEDSFADGRPAWEKVGVQFVDDVAPYELMKLRLLNASHLAVAGLGELMGYRLIGESIGDPRIRRYMAALMDRETGPTLLPVPGVDLAAYKSRLIDRFANPAIKDTTQRVNADAPLNYLLEPIRDRLAAHQGIELLALALAAWLRRAAGTGEDGRPIVVSHPLAGVLAEKARAGGRDPTPLLSVAPLFGDLGRDMRLIDAAGRWLAEMYESGTRATLRRAAADGCFETVDRASS